MENVFTVNNVVLNRRGSHILGTLILSSYHLVFTFQSPTTDTNTSTNTSTSTNTATNSNTSATPSSIVAQKPPPQKEIWICYPIIERISKARGSTWLNNNPSNDSNDRYSSSNSLRKSIGSTAPKFEGFDNYSASHIRLQCKDFTYFSFDFKNDLICCEVFNKMSSLITRSKVENSNNSNNNNNNNSLKSFYAYSYVPNSIEQNLPVKGWDLYDPFEEYDRLGLLPKDGKFWRVTNINEDYKFCPSYPRYMIVPGSISDNVLKHAGKFRSKQRIPAVVYKHKGNVNGNVIARCAQPLVGLNLQNRSIQDEKLIGEIFHSQELERNSRIAATAEDSENNDRDSDSDVEYQSQQPQRNLLVDLRPITNAMAQHALGAGTENVDNYRNKKLHSDAYSKDNGHGNGNSLNTTRHVRQVDKIFCNIDNIHVVRDSLNKLTTILNDLDKYSPPQSSLLPAQNQSLKVSSQHEDDQIEKENEKKPEKEKEKEKEREQETETETEKEQKQREKQQQLKHRPMKQLNGSSSTALQQALTKTQWLHRLSIILQSVDRIIKSIHLNNTNVIIHCSDGWDRTSQVSALAQLCLDPYYRTTRGFMILIEKEWGSFGFKFKTRADHGGCIGAVTKKEKYTYPGPNSANTSNSTTTPTSTTNTNHTELEQSELVTGGQSSLDTQLLPENSTMLDSKPLADFSSNAAASVSSFFQKAAKAARDLKNTAQNGLSNFPVDEFGDSFIKDSASNKTSSSISFSSSTYSGSSERSPVFHQFLDCIYQIYRQKPSCFEFNSRFLKRLLYHYYSCQYGSFLCDSEREMRQVYKVDESTVSVWDYFNSRPQEFKNPLYAGNQQTQAQIQAKIGEFAVDGEDSDVVNNNSENNGVVFFNSADVKWWFELYGRTDEEMNGLSNSLERKFARMATK